MAPVLAYWDIRGLAQPIRLLLNYVGQEFEDKKYVCGPAPDYDKESWFKEKNTLGLAFPNLPYYIDGDIKVSQSNAVLRCIARKHNLCGETEEERSNVDMLADQLMDFRNGFVRVCYNPNNYEENKKAYLASVPKTIQTFSDFLGEKKFLVGDKITFVDFVMYELLDQHKLFEPSLLETNKNLKDFLARIEALPAIAEYMKSDKFMVGPINNPMAVFK